MAKAWAKGFYNSKEWQACRESYIKSVNGLCEKCLENNRINTGYIVHHIEELTTDNINNPEITLGWDNLMYLCQECHNRIHGEDHEVTREGLSFNEFGELIPVSYTHLTLPTNREV